MSEPRAEWEHEFATDRDRDRAEYEAAVAAELAERAKVDPMTLDGPCPGCGTGDQAELYHTDGTPAHGQMFHNVDCVEQWEEAFTLQQPQ